MHQLMNLPHELFVKRFKKTTIPHEEITKNTGQLDEQAVNVEKIAYMDKWPRMLIISTKKHKT